MGEDHLVSALKEGRIQWVDFYWSAPDKKWLRLYDMPLASVQSLLPQAPLAIPPNQDFSQAAAGASHPITKAASAERRIFQRVNVRGEVQLRGMGNFPLINISVGGLLFEASHEFIRQYTINPQIIFFISINIYKFDSKMELFGKVVRKEAFLNAYAMGVQFTDMNPQTKSTLHNFISMQLSLML